MSDRSSSRDSGGGHSSGGEGSHAGHDHANVPYNRLAGAAALNVAFAVVQVIVGLAIGSLVVLADAAHQVVDAIGLITALVAVVLATRPSSDSMSYGWGKMDSLGAFTSGLLLLASTVWIAYESVRRLLDPEPVEGLGVIVIGCIGIAVNGISVLAVGRHDHNLSIRAARLHLLVDLFASVIVVAAGLILAGTTWTWVDPAASLVLCFMVIRSTLDLLGTSTNELLDRAPAGVTPAAVVQHLRTQPGVTQVHHVHVRPLGQQQTSVTAHVVLDGAPTLHDAQTRLDDFATVLQEQLGVAHATLQLECHECEDIHH